MREAMDIEIVPKAMYHAAYTFGVSYVTSELQFLFWLSTLIPQTVQIFRHEIGRDADWACKLMQCKTQGEYELVINCFLFILYFITVSIRIYDLRQFQLIWILKVVKFFTFGPRRRRARSPRRPRGQNVAAIALDMGQAHLWYENNTMQTIHAIQTLRTVCGFLDMGDGCCLIFNKNQLMFIVTKSITAQIKKESFCSFRNKSRWT